MPLEGQPKGPNFNRYVRPNQAPRAGQPTPQKHVVGLVSKDRRVKEILGSIEKLPSLPTVVSQVMQLANDPKSNAGDFDQFIRQDQALTAKMLKLVNSSFFALPNKVTSITRAIVILGYKTLKSLVMAATTSRLLNRNLTCYGYQGGGLWKQSFATAAVARHLGQKRGMAGETAEELFVAGLLQSIGKIILAPYITEHQDEFKKLFLDLALPLEIAEEKLVGMSHPQVGEKIASKWNLDPKLQVTFASINDFNKLGPEFHFLNIIQLSRWLVIREKIGLIAGYPIGDAPHSLLFGMDLTMEDIEILNPELQDLFKDIEPLFQTMGDG